MIALDKDMQMRVFIMDSLIARSGKSLSPDVIGEITKEILERMIEVNDVPLYTGSEERQQ